ncbi:VCBS repeat-containing protein [Streptomyces sp. NPDC020807]|uniref:VCBS repeat-containing protein n=1 Tax=Streptomyces sp. NPDC020807 TaxID=3155119 RepID=UPI0033F342D1
MLFPHSRRAGRIAACTALALSAGMILAGPASADDGWPHKSAQKPTAAPAVPSHRVVPSADGAATAGIAGATASAIAPRSDLDGDGHSDLLYRTNGGATYSVNTTADSSKFTGSSEFSVDIIPIGDQDKNGSRPEVLMLSKFGSLSLYGNASTSSASLRWIGAGWQTYNKVFSPGDLSGDGRADVLARTRTGELWAYLSTGTPNGPFHAPRKVGTGWNAFDQLIGLGDSDGDGRGDFLARTPAGALFYVGSTTNPYVHKAPKQVGHGWQIYNQIVGIDDDNGNGVPDLLARGVDGRLYEYFGTGSGKFLAAKQVSGVGSWSGAGQLAGAGNVPAHGKEGMLARDTAGTLFWYGSLNNGKVSSRFKVSDTGGWAGATFFEVNSLGRDGVPDTLEIYQGRLYNGSAYLGGGWSGMSELAGPGDLNGDGTGDFVARDRDGVLWLYRSNYDGTALHARVRVGSGWGQYNRVFGSSDLTGDGRADLLARHKDGRLFLFEGTGKADYAFKARVQIGTGWNTYKHLVAPGDLNGDGKGDVLGVTSGGDLYPHLNTAPRQFKKAARIGYGYGVYNRIS